MSAFLQLCTVLWHIDPLPVYLGGAFLFACAAGALVRL